MVENLCRENFPECNRFEISKKAPLARFSSRSVCVRNFSRLMSKVLKPVCLTVRGARRRQGKKVKICIGIHASHCQRSESPFEESNWRRRKCNVYILFVPFTYLAYSEFYIFQTAQKLLFKMAAILNFINTQCSTLLTSGVEHRSCKRNDFLARENNYHCRGFAGKSP